MADDQSTSSGAPGEPEDGEMPRVDGPDPAAPAPDQPDPSTGEPTEVIGSAPDPDKTQLTPQVDPYATQALSAADNAATHVIRPPTPDPTAAIPQVPSTWRGSAGVRAGGPEVEGTSTWNPEQPRGRAWWLPIVGGVVGLLIIVGVAYALVRAQHSGTPTPAVSPTAAASTASAPPSTLPSGVPSTPPSPPPSVPPSTVPPTTASATASGPVVVPTTLTGLLFPDVEAELNSLGLQYRLQPQIDNDPSVLPNQVLSTNPVGGSTVAPGTVVTVVYAMRAPSPSPSVSPTTP